MNEFDLIPASYRAAHSARQSLRIAALTAGAVLLCGVLLAAGLRIHNQQAQERLTVLSADSNALAVVESRYKLLFSARAQLRERSALLAALQHRGYATALIAAVEEASASVPLWLHRWDYLSGAVAGSHQMQLRGDSANHEALTRFVDSLLASPAIADVRIAAANERAQNGAIDFQLEVQLRSL